MGLARVVGGSRMKFFSGFEIDTLYESHVFQFLEGIVPVGVA